MAIKREGNIGGIEILSSRVENRHSDIFARGQGFSITLTKVEPDLYRAESADGKFTAEARTEEDAAYQLQSKMRDAGRQGEL